MTAAEKRQLAVTADAHPASYRGTSAIKVKKLGHRVYQVSDMERSVRFWTEVMGLACMFTARRARRHSGATALRFGGNGSYADRRWRLMS